MKQSIKRKRAGDNFTILSNEFLRDENLSLKAKGLLAYILSLPDDWIIYFEEIEKHHKDGKASLRTAWKDLEVNGYARTNRLIDPETKAVKQWYKEVSDYKKPDSDFPDVGFPDVAFPDVGNQQLLNTNILNTNKQNIDNNKTTTTNTGGLSQLSDFYQENFGVINPLVLDDLSHSLHDFGFELSLEAMKRAVRSQRNFRYALQILKAWSKNNIKTLLDVQADDEKFNKLKEKSYKSKQQSFSSNNKIVKPAPEWSGYQEPEYTDEEIADVFKD
ncbi:DnaD domain-containing protein [Lactococcus formosensis]|uniref:DnaD domain-containing protein n=1 Tax=Lactococcus formosensis TaxID=1281486 RepID=UPI002434A138|nr:DnaD domain protein [Lactococcus formosensis]MDG6115402.1 DnaD domain protein [Lactococcus formosensis]